MSKFIPSWLSGAVALVLAVIAGLNVATFGFATPWSQLVTFGCTALAALANAPLTHGALRNALHLSYPTALAFAGVATTACTGLTTASMDATLKGLLVGALTGVAGVLAGPDSAPLIPPSKPQGAAAPPPPKAS